MGPVDNRKLDHGSIIDSDYGNFEVVGVSYTEVDGEKTNFSYTIRDAKEVQDERDAAEEALKVLEQQKEEE